MFFRITATLIWMCTAVAASAQFSKGTILAGGLAGFQYKSIPKGDYSMFQFGVTPSVGFFASKHLVAGPQLQLSYQEERPGNNSFHSLFSLGIGPFLRYYGKIGERVCIFVHGAPLMGWSAERYATDKTQPYLKIFQVQWEAGPGLAILLNKNVALEPSLFYRGVYRNRAIGNTTAPSSREVEHGVVFNIGLQVFLTKNKKGE